MKLEYGMTLLDKLTRRIYTIAKYWKDDTDANSFKIKLIDYDGDVHTSYYSSDLIQILEEGLIYQVVQTVSNEQLREFILSQPRNKKVCMSNPRNNTYECGCLLTQYGQKEGFSFTSTNLYDGWCVNGRCEVFLETLGSSNNNWTFTFFKEGTDWRMIDSCKNFGQLQDLLR